MVNQVTFVGFRGGSPPSWSAPVYERLLSFTHWRWSAISDNRI